MEEKKDNKKLIAIILIIIGFLTVLFGITHQFTAESENKKKKDPIKTILTDLSIDNYLKLALNSNTETNINILDINSDENMMLYFFSNKDLKHYKLKFMSGLNEDMVTFVYARYDQYIKKHQEVFGKEPLLAIDDRDLSIADIIQVEGDDYRMNSGSIGKCDQNKPTECYILLTKYYENKNTVKFSELTMNDNIINGSVSIVGEETVNATFEFKYKSNSNTKVIESLMIKSID